jgi:hypothetical protein
MLRVRLLPIVLFIMLLMFLTPVRPGETAASPGPCDDAGGGDLMVAYVSATPSTLHVGDKLAVSFRVLEEFKNYGQCVKHCEMVRKACFDKNGNGNKQCLADAEACKDGCGGAYAPPKPEGAKGIGTATFLLTSVSTRQTKEYPDTPVTPSSFDGEYRAEIQITPDSPTGQVLVYVKAGSLQASIYSIVVTGPPIDTSSVETEDTSGISVVQIYESHSIPANSPSVAQIESQSAPTRPIGQLTLVALGLLAVLLLPIYFVVRRRPE